MNRPREKEIEKVTLCGAIVNIALSGIKLAAGFFGHSSAMLADAVHSISDLVSDMVVLVMVRVASKGKDRGHDYGHGKYETLATVIVALLLVYAGVELFAGGIRKISRILTGEAVALPGMVALAVAGISIVSKELLYQWTALVGKRTNSPAVVSNAWHHRTDALSSIGSAIGIGLAMLLGGKWAIADPIVACIIGLFVCYIAVKMVIPALGELTEASLPDHIENEILGIIASVDGVKDVHEMKTRRSGPNIIIDTHIVVDPDMSVAEAHRITEKAEDGLRKRFGEETQISIHVEPSAESK